MTDKLGEYIEKLESDVQKWKAEASGLQHKIVSLNQDIRSLVEDNQRLRNFMIMATGGYSWNCQNQEMVLEQLVVNLIDANTRLREMADAGVW